MLIGLHEVAGYNAVGLVVVESDQQVLVVEHAVEVGCSWRGQCVILLELAVSRRIGVEPDEVHGVEDAFSWTICFVSEFDVEVSIGLEDQRAEPICTML